VPAHIQHGLADRLAREQIVAQIDRAEPGVPRAVRRQPAPRSTAFAVLFVVPVLGHDEFWFQRHDPVMAGCDNRGGEHRMERLGLVLAALTVGTVRATDLVRTMAFRSVQRD